VLPEIMSVELIDRTNNNKATNNVEDDQCNLHIHLPDQSDSSENDESSPRKRPRSNHGDIERTEINTKRNWDHYVRSGSKLKSLAGSILDVARHFNTNERVHTDNQENDDVDNNDNNREDSDKSPGILETVSNPVSTARDNVSKLAYEKTAECLMLEKVRFVS
jgi:hypothetical protein